MVNTKAKNYEIKIINFFISFSNYTFNKNTTNFKIINLLIECHEQNIKIINYYSTDGTFFFLKFFNLCTSVLKNRITFTVINSKRSTFRYKFSPNENKIVLVNDGFSFKRMSCKII